MRSAASATAARTDTEVATATRMDPVSTTAGAVAVAAETEAMYTVGRRVWRGGSSDGGDAMCWSSWCTVVRVMCWRTPW